MPWTMSNPPAKLCCPRCGVHLATRDRTRNITVDITRWDAFFDVFSATFERERGVHVLRVPCPECGENVVWRSPGYSFREGLADVMAKSAP